MTWRHVACLLIVTVLVLGCGLSHVCSEPGTLQGVLQLATGIAGGIFGHATGEAQKKHKEPNP